MPRGTWLRAGVDPLPPDPSDKKIDREAFVIAGGVSLIVGKRVLDIGPCYGIDAREFASIAACYVTVDFDELVLEWTAKFAPNARGLVGDARCLPFRTKTFDTVLDFGTLDNVGDPVQGYREACRVLQVGGVLVTTYGNARVLGPGDGVSETYSDPDFLAALLVEQKAHVVHRARENEPRAVMIALKRD